MYVIHHSVCTFHTHLSVQYKKLIDQNISFGNGIADKQFFFSFSKFAYIFLKLENIELISFYNYNIFNNIGYSFTCRYALN